ncbi:MAG: ABC transporter permease [Intrasporangium sp.]|uniref:ABC transporter permease n=1 Tax=Intrasporangium sp. TaxID=1925024 RepID=UPI002647E9D9|nr:ABC transporter permease [Intrasporangium sp.]MDN5794181.1 ABC transporter permease [Intrasporangium sp.]
MNRIGLLWRGLAARRGLTVLILLVAVIAVAAAAAGPAYQAAARHSILADDLHAATPAGQLVEVTSRGGVGVLDQLTGLVDQELHSAPGADLLDTRIRGQEISVVPRVGQTSLMAWRDDLCGHLRLVQGRCPTAAGEVLVSSALAQLNHVVVEQHLHLLGVNRVVGIYEPLDPESRYWGGRGYFPQEGFFVNRPGPEPVDAIFTVPDTFQAVASVQANSVIDLLLDLDAATPGRVDDLRETLTALTSLAAGAGAFVNTNIPTVLDAATASADTLAIPVILITAQLLVLVWLLLFLAITDAAEARGPDVALARLRGLGGTRTLWFGLGESFVLLLLALPLGIAVGWAGMLLLAQVALREGTPVTVGWVSVAAAVIAVSGGLCAALLGARRTLRRSVIEQWRRPSLSTRRGWVLDVAVLVATAAALADLWATGAVGKSTVHPLALLVPGLIGLAVAVLVSRLLPWVCRALFGLTRRRGGIGPFLAVRQVVRRPAGMRTLIVLSAALSLATFAISAWTVNRANIADVAATRTGAAAVLTVRAPADQDLAAIVTRLDPAGTQAMAVLDFIDTANQARQTLAVQSDRLARIAFWRSDFSTTSLAQLAKQLHPPTPAPIRLEGDSLRVSLRDVRLSRPQLLTANLKLPTGFAETPLAVGVVKPGTSSVTVQLPGCPCVLRSLTLSDTTAVSPALVPTSFSGSLTITGIDERGKAGWRPVAAGLDSGDRWSWAGTFGTGSTGSAKAAPGGLHLSFTVPPNTTIGWAAPSWPVPMPALVTPSVAGLPRDPSLTVAGLDGAALPIEPVAVVPVPGAPDNGVIIDQAAALQAAFDSRFSTQQQVWLAPGAVATFPDRLRKAGVQVTDTATTADADRSLRQQGPALALSLFLADAAAAALLAAAGGLSGLYLSARRRRHELAALIAGGARRSELRRSLLLEQALTLGLGILSGVGSGLLAVWLALRAVPQFVTPPSAPPLHYTPDPMALTAALVGIAVIVAVVAVLGTVTLVAGTRTELLREEAT